MDQLLIRPRVTFQRETWTAVSQDENFWPLLEEQYERMAFDHQYRMPLEPLEGLYRGLEEQGLLVVVTARHFGVLAGYCAVLLVPHPHYSTVCGYESVFHLAEELRGRGLAGYGFRFLKAIRAEMMRLNVARLYFASNTAIPIDKMLRRLGFERLETSWGLWIGA